jgi:hypothetical protein
LFVGLAVHRISEAHRLNAENLCGRNHRRQVHLEAVESSSLHGRRMDARETKSAIMRGHRQIEPFARAALLTIFVILGALLSIHLENNFYSAAHIELLFFGSFVVIIASLSFVSGLTETIFRSSDNSTSSGRDGTAYSVKVVPLEYHSRCSEPGCRRLGRILVRYLDGRPQSNREFCCSHGDAKVKRDRAAGPRVYDDREVN